MTIAALRQREGCGQRDDAAHAAPAHDGHAGERRHERHPANYRAEQPAF
jgi:hypothetical protein